MSKELEVVRIHKDTPVNCVVGKVQYTKHHGLTVTRDSVVYKVEIVG